MSTIKPDKQSRQINKASFEDVPAPVTRAITTLGRDLAKARRRRHITQASMALRMGASVSTVRRMEAGDVRVPVHFIARALYVLGNLDAFASLLDSARDDIGLMLMDSELPKRVRSKKPRDDTPPGAL